MHLFYSFYHLKVKEAEVWWFPLKKHQGLSFPGLSLSFPDTPKKRNNDKGTKNGKKWGWHVLYHLPFSINCYSYITKLITEKTKNRPICIVHHISCTHLIEHVYLTYIGFPDLTLFFRTSDKFENISR